MKLSELPTHFAVTDKLVLPYLTLEPGRKVKITTPSGMHLGQTVYVRSVKDNKKYEQWVYFHALISKSDELVDYFFNSSNYKIESDLSASQLKAISKDNYLKETDLINYIFEVTSPIQMSYLELYELFDQQDPVVCDALRNYYFANSLFASSYKQIDTSYWQIVIYLSVIDTLMGSQPQCVNINHCRICQSKLADHNTVSSSKWLNEQFLNKISRKTNRDQYRRVIEECKYRIRNKSVHAGLIPVAENLHFPDGNYYYDTDKSLDEYTKDSNALKSLVKQMQELTRFYALNKIFQMEMYPELRGMNFGYLTLSTNVR